MIGMIHNKIHLSLSCLRSDVTSAESWPKIQFISLPAKNYYIIPVFQLLQFSNRVLTSSTGLTALQLFVVDSRAVTSVNIKTVAEGLLKFITSCNGINVMKVIFLTIQVLFLILYGSRVHTKPIRIYCPR